MYAAGLMRKVLATCKVPYDDDIEGDVNLWACQLVAKHHHRGDIRGLLFVALCRLVSRSRRQRSNRIAREQVRAAQLPHVYYAPDLSSFWDNPESMRILATARVNPPTINSRKQREIHAARNERLRKEHAASLPAT